MKTSSLKGYGVYPIRDRKVGALVSPDMTIGVDSTVRTVSELELREQYITYAAWVFPVSTILDRPAQGYC